MSQVGVQNLQGMTSANMLMAQTFPHGPPGRVPEARSQAPGPALTEKTQGGCQAQRGLVMSKSSFRLTVSMTASWQERRCGVLIVRGICWWWAVATAQLRYCKWRCKYHCKNRERCPNKPDEEWYLPVEMSYTQAFSRYLISPCSSAFDFHFYEVL